MEGVNKSQEKAREFLVQLKQGKRVLSHESFQQKVEDVDIVLE